MTFKTVLSDCLIAICTFPILFVAGCGEGDDPTKELAPESEATIAQQITLGRAGQLDRIELLETGADDAMLEMLTAEDDWLDALVLDEGVISDRGVDAIARLPNLFHLRLRNSPISDQGLERLSACESIQILNLPQCQATADGIASLAVLPDLRNLRLGGNQLTSATAKSIAMIKSLRNVHLISVPIDDEGLRQIASLPKLQSLYLDDSDVTSAGWDWLFEKHPDLHLHVNQQHVDRDHSDHAESDHGGHMDLDDPSSREAESEQVYK
jgi:hypothetical protein